MFNVVSPKKRAEFAEDLQQMFDRLAIEYGNQGRDAYDHDQAIYVICSHKKFGVIGGARLIPMDAQAITKDFLKRLKFNSKQKIYEISRVFFHIPNNQDIHESSEMFELICRDFYQGLFEALKTISIAQKVKAFISVLSMEDHKDVLHYGLWPFEKQAKIASPYNNDEPYVLGIMPMNERLYETFLMRRSNHEQKLHTA